eukprot:10161422-Alexandrium_andersonii.AAC.1
MDCGGPRSTGMRQKAPEGPRGLRRAQGSFGEPRRAPRERWRAQERAGRRRRARESPAAPPGG